MFFFFLPTTIDTTIPTLINQHNAHWYHMQYITLQAYLFAIIIIIINIIIQIRVTQIASSPTFSFLATFNPPTQISFFEVPMIRNSHVSCWYIIYSIYNFELALKLRVDLLSNSRSRFRIFPHNSTPLSLRYC